MKAERNMNLEEAIAHVKALLGAPIDFLTPTIRMQLLAAQGRLQKKQQAQ